MNEGVQKLMSEFFVFGSSLLQSLVQNIYVSIVLLTSHGTARLALSPFVLMQYIFHSVKAEARPFIIPTFLQYSREK